eukprot:Em0004g1181a
MITLKWQPPPYPIGEIITYQVTYTVNGSVDINAYNSTTPLMNGVYQFGIVADVAIMNLLLQGDIPQTGSTIMIADGNPVSNIAATIGESLIIGGALGGLFTLAILIATVVIAMQLWKRFRSISVNTSVPNRDGIAMKEIYAEVQDNNPNHFSEKESETHIYDAAVCATGQYNNSDQISTNECEAYGCFDYNATVKPEENIYAN